MSDAQILAKYTLCIRCEKGISHLTKRRLAELTAAAKDLPGFLFIVNEENSLRCKRIFF
jgi:hypothetical protein